MELKDKIYTLRKKYNLTYEQIAEVVGVGKSTVRKWETGIISSVRDDKLENLAKALHTTVDYLKGNRDELVLAKDNGFGFYKIAAATPRIKVANPTYNLEQIKKAVDAAVLKGAQILITPELSLCGYTCADLFRQKRLIDVCVEALCGLLKYTAGIDMFIVVGMPIQVGFNLFDCAVALNKGKILGVVPKEYLTDSADTAENRWFSSGREVKTETITLCGQQTPFGKLLFSLFDELTVGIEIGADLFSPLTPGTAMALKGANLILNISAFSDAVSKNDYIMKLASMHSAKCYCAYALANAGGGESTTDSVFSGGAFVYENGRLLAEGKRFARDGEAVYACVDVQKINSQRIADTAFVKTASLNGAEYTLVNSSVKDFDLKDYCGFVDPHPFIPADTSVRKGRCEEIFSIQASALAKRLEHTGLKRSVIGISGGLDSTLALLVCVKASEMLGLDNGNIIGITMPGFGTTDRTYNNAIKLMKALGINVREISIKRACETHLEDIGHDLSVHDITYENAQARERTQILMDIANKEGGILVGTGDLSEIAMGWCTYNADHMSMYGVNAGIPKTLVRYLVDYVASKSEKLVADILYDILDTPVSPELLPPDEAGNIAQKTEDKIGPYELHDFFLYNFFRFGFEPEKIAFLASEAFMGQYSKDTIDKWLKTFLRRFFISQFKRSCTPDAPKIGSVSLSPRGDWRMPSDADFEEWLK